MTIGIELDDPVVTRVSVFEARRKCVEKLGIDRWTLHLVPSLDALDDVLHLVRDELDGVGDRRHRDARHDHA